MHEIFSLPIMSEIWNNTDGRWGINLPNESLYHYTSSVATVKSILTAQELWLSKYTVMNDYTEIQYGVSLIENIMIEKSKEDRRFERLIDSFRRFIRNEITDYFIMSFSQNGNSRLLWDSYALKSGYCIEFSPTFISDFIYNEPLTKMVLRGDKFVTERVGKRKVYLKKAQESPVGYGYEVLANKVLYDDKKQKQLLIEVMDYISNKMDDNKNADINIAINALVQTIPFLKDPTLKDEEEYRLVIHISPNKEEPKNKKQYLRSVQYYRESGNKLFPFVKLQLETLEYVKSIAVGYMNCNELSMQTMEEFLATLPYDIKLKKYDYPLRW